ncbi:glycosyltransferase family 4 protein [Nanoarchaeota archaeon]
MKILFITRKYPPIVGGMEQYSYRLIKEFSNSDNKIHKITLGKRQYWLPLFIPHALFKGWKICRKKDIDIVHFQDGAWTFFAYLFKLISKKPVAITFHGTDVSWDGPFYQAALRKFLPKLDRIYCVSEGLKKELAKKGVPRNMIHVINNGIDPKSIQRTGNKEKAKKDLANYYGYHKDSKVLVTVGRIRERKGQLWFVENCLDKIKGDFVYIIVGDGMGREELEDLILEKNTSNVFMTGNITPLPGRRITRILEAADVFLMPNIHVEGEYEGFGIVNTEASAFGVPVVAANIGGVGDAVEDKVSGIMVKPGDSEAYARAVNSLLRSAKKRKELGKNGMDMVKRKFTWNKVMKAYEKDFKKVAK